MAPQLTTTDFVVRLHTDADGRVWYGADGEPVRNTGLTADGFVADRSCRDVLRDARVVRLLGTAANAALVTRLYEHRMCDAGFRLTPVWLGAPAAVPAAWLRGEPAAVLYALWQPTPAVLLAGRWHEMTAHDYVVYGLVCLVGGEAGGGRDVPDVAWSVVPYHPAWPAVTFLAGADRQAACRLLAVIRDPRWYRHPTRPGRLSRLYAYLGLTPDNLAVLAGQGGRPGRHFDRAELAVRAWCGRPAAVRPGDPAGFLFRRYAEAATPARGLLRATQQFVRFVVSVWLDAVCGPHPEARFRPELFFADGATAAAFDRHLQAVRAGRSAA